MDERILLTGATGNIGRIATQRLISLGVPIRVFTRDEEKARRIVKDKANIARGDYANAASLDAALEGIEKLFLVAPALENIDTLEKLVIDAAKKKRVKQVVLISAMGVGPDADTLIGKKHAAVEEYLKASGMAFTILRPHSFMQNLLANIPTIQHEGKIYAALGEGAIPMVDARDIGEVVALILRDDGFQGETLNVTGPKAVNYREVAQSFSSQLERDITYVPVPGEAAEQAMVGMGFPAWLAHDLVTMMAEWAAGEHVEVADTVERVLDRTPRTVGEFISDHIKLFKPESES